MPRSMTGLRSVCRKAALGLLPLLLLLVTAEFVQRLRYSITQGTTQWMFYGTGWKKPRVPLISASDAGCDGAYDRHAINILAIGGSSTYGVFNDRQHTYPRLLGALLNARASAAGAARLNVVNCGKPSHSAEDYRATVDRELARYTPDVAIFYTGYNDIFIKDVNRVYQTFSAKLYSALAVLEDYSLLVVTATEKYLIWTSNRPRDGAAERERRERLGREFRSALDRAIDPLAGRRVRVILIPEVLMARNFGGIGHNYETYASRYAGIPGLVREVAARRGAEFLDLQKDFEVADFTRLFVDPVHLTDTGNRVLSERIFERSTTLRELAVRTAATR